VISELRILERLWDVLYVIMWEVWSGEVMMKTVVMNMAREAFRALCSGFWFGLF